MIKLNQILAKEKGVKARTSAEFTRLHRDSQKLPLLEGLSRTYQPFDEDGEIFPPERKLVQLRLNDVLTDVATTLTELFDVVATKDETNREAVADVRVDGRILLDAVPVTTLLFLEKQLADLKTFVSKLPTLDPADRWDFDPNVNAFATDPVKTNKAKKIPRNHVKAPATDKHPAQVEVYMEDVQVGQWTLVKFSGALPAQRVRELIRRVDVLSDAVKVAREAANTTEVTDRRIGKPVFDFLFAE